MYVYTLEIKFLIDDAFSLKDKRRTVRSIVERAQHRFKVAAAEIGSLELINQGEVGFAAVSNSKAECQKLLDKLLYYIESTYPISIISQELIER